MKDALEPMHDVYWRTHGCELQPGHTEPCECDCGEKLKDDNVYGPDKDTAVREGR